MYAVLMLAADPFEVFGSPSTRYMSFFNPHSYKAQQMNASHHIISPINKDNKTFCPGTEQSIEPSICFLMPFIIFFSNWRRVVHHCIRESTRKARPNTLLQGTKYPFISSFSAFLYTSSTVAKVKKTSIFNSSTTYNSTVTCKISYTEFFDGLLHLPQ